MYYILEILLISVKTAGMRLALGSQSYDSGWMLCLHGLPRRAFITLLLVWHILF